jgi:hypothetical protein
MSVALILKEVRPDLGTVYIYKDSKLLAPVVCKAGFNRFFEMFEQSNMNHTLNFKTSQAEMNEMYQR